MTPSEYYNLRRDRLFDSIIARAIHQDHAAERKKVKVFVCN